MSDRLNNAITDDPAFAGVNNASRDPEPVCMCRFDADCPDHGRPEFRRSYDDLAERLSQPADNEAAE